MRLDDLAAIGALDGHGVRHVLAAFPAQCRDATELAARPAVPVRQPALVVVAAMGGSAASGDLLAACVAERLSVPVIIHRGYGLPAAAVGDTLVIASSYSGDTAEVVAAARAAVARALPMVTVTTGGALAALAREHGVAQVTLPAGLMPRMALGYLFFPLLRILADAGLEVVSPAEAAEALDVVGEMACGLAPERPSAANEAKQLALTMATRTPAIYGGPVTGAVAYRWKTDLAENAKVFALAGTLPEMNHNEIEAWQGTAARAMQAVLLRDHQEAPEIARRFDVLRQLIEPAAGGVVETWARGKSRLARLLSLAYLGEWTSYYVAMLRGVDPWPIPLLDELKRRTQS